MWGAAYELVGATQIQDALGHLTSRECTLGGYGATTVNFYPRECQCAAMETLVFMAGAGSACYLGPAPSDIMAGEIYACAGPNGTNVEYVLFLAWFLRQYIPESQGYDEHLDSLEESLLQVISREHKTQEDFIRPLLKPMNLIFETCVKCVS